MDILVICDIDETIADNSHRLHRLDGGGTDLERFMRFLEPELVLQDAPIPHAHGVLEHLQSLGAQIIFLTGRGQQLRPVTLTWLQMHFPTLQNWRLITRSSADDGVPASVYKTRKLDELRNDPVLMRKRWLCFDDDRYLWSVYRQRYDALVFHAPHCWATLFPDAGDLPPEVNWRR